MQLLTPISPGELLDKLSILQIKLTRMAEPAKLANVKREHELLNGVWRSANADSERLSELTEGLRKVNEALWDIEDAIREEEAMGRFGQRFIELARSVYFRNDERSALKRQINELLGSEIIEEKSYRDYRSS